MGRIDAVSPVLDDVQALVGRIADAAPQVARAARRSTAPTTSTRPSSPPTPPSPPPRMSGRGWVRVAADLAAGLPSMAQAEDRMARLLVLQDRVLAGGQSLDDAAATLTRLHDLRDGLHDASGTVSGIQHMIVDVMLLQPAVDRAVAALKPVIELTRTARQADPAAMSPRPVVERSESMPVQAAPAERPATPAPVAGTTAAVVGAAPEAETVK